MPVCHGNYPLVEIFRKGDVVDLSLLACSNSAYLPPMSKMLGKPSQTMDFTDFSLKAHASGFQNIRSAPTVYEVLAQFRSRSTCRNGSLNLCFKGFLDFAFLEMPQNVVGYEGNDCHTDEKRNISNRPRHDIMRHHRVFGHAADAGKHINRHEDNTYHG